MMREGFSHGEIYDILTNVGLPGEQVQLIMDRVAVEFRSASIRPRPSRLAEEVGTTFREVMDDFKHETFTRMDSITHRLELVDTNLRRLVGFLVELRSAVSFKAGRRSRRLKRKIP